MKRYLILAYILAALGNPQILSAEPVAVQWAGVSFLSPPQDTASLAPTLQQLMRDKALQAQMDARIRSELASVGEKQNQWRLVSDQLMTQGDDSYLLTFAIAMENIETVSSGNLTGASYEIQASVLVVNLSKDASRQRIVTNYPVRVRFNTLDAEAPDAQERKKIFQKLLLSPSPEMPDLVHQWALRAENIELREKKVWLRVPPIHLTAEARSTLDSLSGDNDDRAIVKQIEMQGSALLESQISEKLDIPVIPFGARGEMEAMTLQFANLDASQSFKPPNPDYSVRLEVRALRHAATQSESGSGLALEQQIFGGSFLVSLIAESPDPNLPGHDLAPALQLRRIDSTDRYAAGTRKFSQLLQFRKLVGNFTYELGQAFFKADTNWFKTARSDFEPRDPKQLAKAITDFTHRFANQ